MCLSPGCDSIFLSHSVYSQTCVPLSLDLLYRLTLKGQNIYTFHQLYILRLSGCLPVKYSVEEILLENCSHYHQGIEINFLNNFLRALSTFFCLFKSQTAVLTKLLLLLMRFDLLYLGDTFYKHWSDRTFRTSSLDYSTSLLRYLSIFSFSRLQICRPTYHQTITSNHKSEYGILYLRRILNDY